MAKKTSITVENYLKEIFLISEESGEDVVAMGRIAQAMGVVPGTATTMIKMLERDKWLTYEPRVGVRLSRAGRDLAVKMLRRHRLIEYFLVKTLGMDWTEIHDEAERLEHAISDRVLNKIDCFLGYPETDPHGDVIPNAQGVMVNRALKRLSQCEEGEEVTIARIKDQNPEFLNFVYDSELTPGEVVRVAQRNALADSITLEKSTGETVAFGSQAAEKIEVENKA